MSGVERGCGTRVAGGVYLVCPLVPGGRPVEDFLIDPPQAFGDLTLSHLGISPRGVTAIERQDGSGVVDVFDWIGSQHYPNVADFVEEVRRFGLSRRIARTFDFSRLSKASRIICLHARAVPVDPVPWYQRPGFETASQDWPCPCGRPDHGDFRRDAEDPARRTAIRVCAGIWWEDIDGGGLVVNSVDPYRVRRKMPAFEYDGRSRPSDPAFGKRRRGYLVGAFASFPISAVEYVIDNDEPMNEGIKVADRLDGCVIPWRYCDE
jgi:hypothetical protein